MAPEDCAHGRGRRFVSPAAYERDDESPDDRFYAVPRKVVHIDDGAIAALTQLYGEVLPSGARLLDLMSSWRSHLPPGAGAVGLGLNAEEMADNPQLTRHVVHDVNRVRRLPFDEAEFDGATCAVSIQYAIHPVWLFREVHRGVAAERAVRVDRRDSGRPVAPRRRRSAVRPVGSEGLATFARATLPAVAFRPGSGFSVILATPGRSDACGGPPFGTGLAIEA